MKDFLRGIGRFLLLVATAVAGLVGGFVGGEMYCIHFVVPEWVRESPHDGQLGLGVLVYAVFGAFLGLVLSVAVLVMLILLFSRDPRPAEEASERERSDTPIQLHLS